MLIDLHRTPAPARLDAEVVVVGAGAAGLAIALELDRAGVATLLVEAGGDGFSKEGQELYRAASIAPDKHGPVHLYRRRAFGGTTAVWGGRCIPFDPIDLEDRPWLADARWPIAHADLAAHYPRALEICRAGAPVFTAAEALPGAPGPLVAGVASPDLVLDRIERFSEPTHFGRAYARQLEASKVVTILRGATVTAITTADGGARATGARAMAPGGAAIDCLGRQMVVAAGGLETPRLLLASTAERACGLGNERDQVGRYYQSHIEGELGRIRFLRPPRDVHLDYQRDPAGIYCRRYLWLSPEAQRRERLAGLIARPAHASIVDPAHGHPVLSAIYLVKNFVVPEYSRKLTSTERRVKAAFAEGGRRLLPAHLVNLLRHPVALAGFSTTWARRRTLARRKLPSVVLRDRRNAYPLDINAEQEPNRASRVDLGDERDAFGLPKLRIRWATTADDFDRIRRGMVLMAGAFAGTGAAEIDLAGLDEQLAELTRIGGHHIGTARMGDDPAMAVADADGALFGTANLHLAGAALFPTSGFANPTLTIVALSVRLAHRLAGLAGRPPR